MRQLRSLLKRRVQSYWKPLAVAAGAGLLVMLFTWLLEPGIFAIGGAQPGTVVTAEVTGPMSCASPNAPETVRFLYGGQTRAATLSACGHDQGESVEVAVSADAGDAGPISARIATNLSTDGDPRRPVGLLLVALSCGAGGLYALLVIRARLRALPRPALRLSEFPARLRNRLT